MQDTGLFSTFCKRSGLPRYFSLLQCCFPGVFLHSSITSVQVHSEMRIQKKNKYMSTDLAGGEFVIILFNGIDFLFIFTAEEKGRTVNKRIMLLSH